jgi:hypothetical protein
MVPDPKLGRDVKKRDWEIELFGTGKQVVLPPSIHPDTGQAVRLGASVRPRQPRDRRRPVHRVVASRQPRRHRQRRRAEDAKPPLGLTDDEIQDILDALPLEEYCEDRDGWLQVGMALHHETGGGEDGYDLWCDFSKQSEKFNEREQRKVWNSFKPKANSVRMASLKAVVNEQRLMEQFDEVPLDDGNRRRRADRRSGGRARRVRQHHRQRDGAGAWVDVAAQTLKDGDGQWANTSTTSSLIVRNDARLVGLPRLNEFTQETVQRTPPGTQPDRRQNQAKPTLQLSGRIWDVERPAERRNLVR